MYLMFALVKETAGSSRLYCPGIPLAKKPRRREMSARGYALYKVCPQLSFFFFSHLPALARTIETFAIPAIVRMRPVLSLILESLLVLIPSRVEK